MLLYLNITHKSIEELHKGFYMFNSYEKTKIN